MNELAHYSGIKYFDSIHPPQLDNTESYNIKFSKSESELTLNKVLFIFEKSFLSDLIEELKTIPSIFNYKDGIRQIVFNNRINFHPFNFDEEGKIDAQQLIISNSQSSSPMIQKAARIGIERLAKELGWKNDQHFVGMNIIRYNLPTGQSVNPVKWHADVDTHHSLVILLEDPSGQDGWTGGNFRFTARRQLVDELDNKILFSNLNKTIRNSIIFNPETPTWEIIPQANHGVLFSNIGTLHTVAPMRAFSETKKFVPRTILTFFEAKPESERLFT